MSVIDRRQLGSMLRQARQARGLTIQRVVELLADANVQVSVSGLTQWEQGKRGPRPQDLTPLLAVLEVTDPDTVKLIYELAALARKRNWWSADAASLRNSFTQLIGLEGDAERIEEYSATVVPGLLQTREYAAAIMNAAATPLDDETMARRTEIRMQRQAILLGPNSSLGQHHVVLDEGCIRRQVGGPDVWHAQLAHLLDVAKQRRIIIQVLPFTAGAHAGTMGGFTLLTFSKAPQVTYVELAGTDVYAEGSDADRYRLQFDKLREQALPEPLSLRLIEEVANLKD